MIKEPNNIFFAHSRFNSDFIITNDLNCPKCRVIKTRKKFLLFEKIAKQLLV